MGLKPRRPPESSRLTRALAHYQETRARANKVWESLYEGKLNPPASEAQIAKLQEKFGRPLPADYVEFLRLHDGWEEYEYERYLLSVQEILDEVADESVENNVDNISEDDADTLSKWLVIGMSNNDASVLCLDNTVEGEPQLVDYYVGEEGRWASITEMFEELAASLSDSIASEDAQQKNANADWEPEVRAQKHATYQGELLARLNETPVSPFPELSEADRQAVSACAALAANQPTDPTTMKHDGLETYMGVVAYMLYVPTADEVTGAVNLFRKHFPWDKRTQACAPSDEYGRKVIASDATDYSEFLKVQTQGHFGLRMVDDDGDDSTTHIFNFRGVPEYHGEHIATMLEILLPVDTDPQQVMGLMRDYADELPLVHGFAGFVTLPLNSNYAAHMNTFYEWSRAHWGLQVALADELCNPALHGLHGVSWLTLIDNETAGALSTAGRLANLPGVNVHRGNQATLLAVGDGPSLGDIRVGYPETLARVHHALGPLMSPKTVELRHFDNDGATQAWWHRFERPSEFALAPFQLFESIEAACEAGDADGLKRLWLQVQSREPAAAKSMQDQLSKLAHALLGKEKTTIAAVLYDWLTQYERPNLSDLNNALCAAWGAPELAPVFIERALPMAEKNPGIFHNVIGLHTEHGHLDDAVAVAKLSVPHYELRLFRKLKTDKDFAPLFEHPEFVKIYDKLKARLEPAGDWPELARNPALETRVGGEPDNLTVYRDYAAWLAGAGDPRGPLISAHMDMEEEPRSKDNRKLFRKLFKQYVKNRITGKFPSLHGHIDADWFRHGLLYRLYMMSLPPSAVDDGFGLLHDGEGRLLRRLYLNKMDVDLALLEHVPHLTLLNLPGAKFPSLEPVTKLEQLDELRLSATDVTDLSLLSSMHSLRKLYLQDTQVTDLTPISKLPNLEFISLEGSAATNIEPLLELPRLCEVWLYKTGVPKAQADKVEQVIKARNTEPGPGVTTMVYGP